MRKIFLLAFVLSNLFFEGSLFAQSCVPTNLNGTVIGLSCGNPCTNIRVQVPHLKSTSEYTVNEISYDPLPYVVATGGTEDLGIYEDDQWSDAFTLPFNFCFYDQTYTQAVIASNGLISFDISNANAFNTYNISAAIPANAFARAAIMGMYTDLDPRRKNEPSPTFPWVSPYDRKIQWRVEGTAPCRKFIVSYYKVGTYQYDSLDVDDIDPCFLTPNTFQMIMYESTGLIEVHVENRSCFGTSGGGNFGILGIQDWNRTKAVAAPGKNRTLWTAQKEAYRFTPSGGASRFVSSEILDMTGTVLLTADTTTTVPGLLDISFPNLCPGPGATQYVIRTTFGSCPAGTTMTSLDTVTIQRNNTLPVTTALVQPTCNTNSGSITVNVATGVGTTPYSFSINGGPAQASNVFSGLAAGTYTIYATDATGCDTSYQVILNAISNLTANINRTNNSCPGNNNGTITVVPTSGTGPYTYTLNPGGLTNTTGVFTNLAPGTYTILYLDALNCNGTATATIAPGTSITASDAHTPTSCAGANNGSITITPTSGTAPYTYALDGGAPQASGTFNGVGSGPHSVLVRDATGCTVTVSVTVTPGSGLTGAITSTPATCPGINDGTVTLTAPFGTSPGTPPYSYSLDGGAPQASGTFTGVSAGLHAVTFTDANGCQGTRSINVTGGTPPSTTATSANTSCAGASDGVIVFNPVAGSTYTLNPGAISNTTGTFTGLPTGIYTLSLSTAGGCSGTVTPSTVTIGPGPVVTGTATAAATSCPGAINGSVTVNPVGTGTTTYTLNPGAVSNTTGIFNNLAAGTYTVTFVTSAGCTGSVSPNPVVNAGPAVSTTAVTAATSCPGISDGTVTVNPVGTGTTYTINPGGASNTTGIFTGLAAGTYTVTFLTGAGCTGSVSPNPVVSAGPAIVGTATTNNTSCPTVNNGSVTVTTPLGAGTTYTITPGGTTNTTGIFTGLAPNTYTISFVTAAGCTGTVTPNPVVAAGPLLTSTFAQTNPVCNNINDGVITITPQAGTAAPYTATLTGPGGPYNYTGNAPIVFSNLAPGTYNYSYAEAGGCTGTGGPVTLVTNPPISTPAALTNLSCNNSANGSVTFNPAGGVAPYQYSSNAGGTYQTSNIFDGLAAGPHTFRIRDNVGCIKDTTITLTQPAVLTTTVTGTTPAGCSNNDGTISATAAGGTAPYAYTIAGGITNTTGSSTGIFTGLANGPYTITATDSKGCTATTTGTIGLTDNMFLTLGPDVTICAESSVTFDPQTNPETDIFTWTGINGTATNTIANPGIKNAVATPADTATYVLHAQWGGCERRDTIIVNLLHKPVPNAGLDTAICNLTYAILRGSASKLSGTVNYAWSPTTNVEFPDQAVTRVYPAGSDTTYIYTLTVTDNYGCNFSVTDHVEVRVQPPVPAFAGNDTTAVLGTPHQLMASGGQDYLWSPPAPLNNATIRNPLATLQADQKFVVRVTDFAGCIGYDTVFVKAYQGPAYYIPNAFTPNGDGLNDVFRPVPTGIAKTEYFRIFNRYGETIFETNQYMKGWDGTFKGKKQAIGAYVWIIKGIDRNGKAVEMKGTVMLVQ